MTDDQIKDLFKYDDPEDLSHLYFSTKEAVEKSKGRRLLYLRLAFGAAVLAILGSAFDILHAESVLQVVCYILLSYFLSAALFWINFYVFSWFITKQQEDNGQLELVEKRLRFLGERAKAMSGDELSRKIAARIWSLAEPLESIHHRDPKSVAAVLGAFLYSVQSQLTSMGLFDDVHFFLIDLPHEEYEDDFFWGDDMDGGLVYTVIRTCESLTENGYNLKSTSAFLDFYLFVNSLAGNTPPGPSQNISSTPAYNVFGESIFRLRNYVAFFKNQRDPEPYSPPWM